jgi:hypothetical protein
MKTPTTSTGLALIRHSSWQTDGYSPDLFLSARRATNCLHYFPPAVVRAGADALNRVSTMIDQRSDRLVLAWPATDRPIARLEGFELNPLPWRVRMQFFGV